MLLLLTKRVTISIQIGFVVTVCTGKCSGRYTIEPITGMPGFCNLYTKCQSFMYISERNIHTRETSILSNTNCRYTLCIYRACLQPEVSSFCCTHFYGYPTTANSHNSKVPIFTLSFAYWVSSPSPAGGVTGSLGHLQPAHLRCVCSPLGPLLQLEEGDGAVNSSCLPPVSLTF